MCNFETSGAHYCPGCNGFVRVLCGRTQGEEGYGSPVYCNKCEDTNATRQTDSIVAGINRRLNKLHDPMLVSAAKRFVQRNVERLGQLFCSICQNFKGSVSSDKTGCLIYFSNSESFNFATLGSINQIASDV